MPITCAWRKGTSLKSLLCSPWTIGGWEIGVNGWLCCQVDFTCASTSTKRGFQVKAIPIRTQIGVLNQRHRQRILLRRCEKFETVYQARQTTQGCNQTCKLLYVGRYIEAKGIQELWSAFVQLSPKFPEWELHCIGAGHLWNSREIHPKSSITVRAAIGTHEYLVDADAFIMPSKKEPWGVVLHEMALAGLPLLASKQVGSSELFLEADKNGFSVDCATLEHSLRCLFKSSKPQLQAFGQHSRTLGKSLCTANGYPHSCNCRRNHEKHSSSCQTPVNHCVSGSF